MGIGIDITKQMLTGSLYEFVKRSFKTLNPGKEFHDNWHVETLCSALESVHMGKIKRLIVCMPPRYLKSICTSVAFPAWILAKQPEKRIIVASYGSAIADKLSIDSRNLMQSKWYGELFPESSLAIAQQHKFITKKNGFRLGVSLQGSITGEGGDVLIADDIHKPIQVFNKESRNKTYEWFVNTFCSRLDDKSRGSIVIIMQRLHADDLVGRLLKGHIQPAPYYKIQNSWHVLNLQALAEMEDLIREQNEPLNPKFEDITTLAKIQNEIGEYTFDSQYQQKPKAKNQSFIKESHIQYYTKTPTTGNIIISIDSASKTGENNDFTAITIWKISSGKFFLTDLIHKKMQMPELLNCVRTLSHNTKPKAILIEDASSGTALMQILKRDKIPNIMAIKPQYSKEYRLISILSYFEQGAVLFPTKELGGDIGKTCKDALTNFPNDTHDDIVDSITQVLNWHSTECLKTFVSPSIRSL